MAPSLLSYDTCQILGGPDPYALYLEAGDNVYRVHGSLLALHSEYWKEESGDHDIGHLEPKELEDILAKELDTLLSVVYARSVTQT